MVLLLSDFASGLPDRRKDGGFCCHDGFDLFDGRVGRKLTGLCVSLPLLPLWGGSYRKTRWIKVE